MELTDGIDKEEQELVLSEVVERRMAFEDMMQRCGNPWGLSDRGLESKKAAMAILSTKTGLYARIPIVCKGHECPYRGSCDLLDYGLEPTGERCVLEITMIEQKLAYYTEEFELDEESYTDWTLVKELINADIMIERCMAIISQEGTAIEEIFIGSNENTGENFFRRDISKVQDLYERNLKIKERILDTMMATRKAKSRIKGDDNQAEKNILENIFEMDFIEDIKPDNL